MRAVRMDSACGIHKPRPPRVALSKRLFASLPAPEIALELCSTRRIMASMSHPASRKVFIVVAGGNPLAELHFEDTIQRKRTLDEVRRFLPTREIENLERIYHGSNFHRVGRSAGTDERIPMGEDGARRRGAYLQQWSHPLCG
jgi:hypothetical protein